MSNIPSPSSEREAFEELYREEGGAVYGFILRLLPGGRGADDCLQETFIRAWRARERYEERRKRRSYLLTIARNVVMDHLSRENGEERKMRGLREQARGAAAAGPPEAGHLLVETVRLMRDKIGELPMPQREAILLYRYHGLTAAEIAEIQGTTRRAVETHIYRGMKALRKSLEPHRGMFGNG